MSFKTTCILFGILAFMIFIVAVAVIRTDGTDEKDTSQFVFPSTQSVRSPLKTDDIEKIEIDRNKPAEKIILVREAGRWKMTQPADFRASTTAVANLVQQVFDAKKDPKAAKNLTLEQCGLNEPTGTVTLTPAEGKGKPLQLTVKDYDDTKGTYGVMYVLSSDRGDKTPMAVRKSSLDSVLLPAMAFRDRDMLNPTASDYKAVKLSMPGKPTVALEKAGGNLRWRYTEPFPGDADYEGESGVSTAAAVTEGPNGVRSLLEDLAGLQVAYKDGTDNDFVADNVKDDALAQFNLDPKSPQLRIEVTLAEKDNKTSKAVLLISATKKERDKDEKKDKEDPNREKNFYFARLEHERTVVRLPAKSVEPLLRLLDKPDCLRERQLVTFAGGKTPDAMVIKNENATLDFFHPDPAKPWLLYRGDTALSADNPTVAGLLSLLGESRKNLVYLDPKGIKDADLGLDKPAIEASFYVDGLAPPEKKEEKKDKKDDKKDGAKEEAKAVKPKLKDKVQPALKLLLVKSKKAGDPKAIVKREAGSDISYVEVPMVLFERLDEGALGYLDKTLPPYNPGSFAAADKDVTKLVLLRDGTTFELSREAKEGAPWKIDKPADLAGRTADNSAVNSILNTLNTLRAVRLVAEKPSAEILDKKYGLKSPTTRAVVTLTKEGKTTTFEYDFGKEEGTDQRFARQSQRDVVFVVDKSVLEPLRRDLLDLSILTFDLNKVQSMKLVGWDLPITLEAERKGPKIWLPKVPPTAPTAKLDEDKFESFLFDLSHLRAEKIVSRNTKPTAEQEMDVSKGALVIEIMLEGEKPLKLTIGKQDGEAGFLAVCDSLPDIFLVSKALFQEPKSKYQYFLKKK